MRVSELTDILLKLCIEGHGGKLVQLEVESPGAVERDLLHHVDNHDNQTTLILSSWEGAPRYDQ